MNDYSIAMTKPSIEYLHPTKEEKQKGTHPAYEVSAPEGYCFEPKLHSLMAYSLSEARQLANGELITCEKDCDCFVDE